MFREMERTQPVCCCGRRRLGQVVIAAKPFERTVQFTLNGQPMTFKTWSDTSALWAIRFLGRSEKPARGCEMGSCGTCESMVDGLPTRLCQMASTSLQGRMILTGGRGQGPETDRHQKEAGEGSDKSHE